MNHRILPTMVMSSLVDRVARKDLMYLVLSRATVSAERAQAMKIVTEVVPAARLDAAAAELVAIFEATPTAAMAGVKEYLAAAYDMPITRRGRLRAQLARDDQRLAGDARRTAALITSRR